MNEQRDRPLGVDLFAGAGGMSLGFERAGFDVVAAVDSDPVHCATHAFNFPYSRPICSDAANLSGAAIRQKAGIGDHEIEVVFGGPPCQGFSPMGKRALADPRNALVHHFVRLVAELQPAYFAFENVPGLARGKHKQFLDELIAAFAASGYSHPSMTGGIATSHAVLNACNHGVPQDRKRLFVLGARCDRPHPAYPAPIALGATVQDAIGDLPEADRFPELRERDWTEASFGVPSAYARKLRGWDGDAEAHGYRRHYNASLLTASRRTAHTQRSRDRFAATEFGRIEPVSRFLKLDPNSICNTLRAGTGNNRGAFTSPRPIHPHTPRCITNREAARLHGFPDWFRVHVTKWHGFRQIGNAVPPPLAQAVAGELLQAGGQFPRAPATVLNLGDPQLLKLTAAQAARHYGVGPAVRRSGLAHSARSGAKKSR